MSPDAVCCELDCACPASQSESLPVFPATDPVSAFLSIGVARHRVRTHGSAWLDPVYRRRRYTIAAQIEQFVSYVKENGLCKTERPAPRSSRDARLRQPRTGASDSAPMT